MRTILVIASIFICFSMMKAQKTLSLDDVTPGGKNYSKFVPKNLLQIQWQGDSVLFVEADSLIVIEAKTQKRSVLFTLYQLNRALKEKSLKLKKLPALFPYDKNQYYFIYKKTIYLFDVAEKQITTSIKLPKNAANIDFCKENKSFAFTSGNNLWIANEKGVKQINPSDSADVIYGQAVHRNEFGIMKGTFWSPKGKYLAFYRMDESMVADYVLTDNSKRKATNDTIKYPYAGTSSHKVTVGVYDVKKDTFFYLQTGLPWDRFFTNLSWSPDEKLLLIAELERAQNKCKMKAYDVQTGIARTLFTEASVTYVEPEHPALFVDSTHYIWQSERTGHNHLYLYDLNAVTGKALTNGDWDVLELVGYSSATNKLIIATTIDSPLEKNLYSVNLDGGSLEKISTVGGQHTASLSASGKYLLDNYHSMTVPRQIDIINLTNKNQFTILQAENPYAKYLLPEIKFGTIKADDGKTDLHYRLTLPLHFDPNKKYPVIVYVYGGPHVQMVQNAWLGGSRGWEYYLASEGYVCFTLDSRGSMNRGQAFEQAVFQNIGKAAFDDQLLGVEFLKSQSYVDSTRMGVYGWSFGGFMSTQLMCKASGTFKVGVAGGSVIDWRLYEVMYGERYMGTPQNNPEGYVANDLTQFAGDLSGDFMMIHCELDPVVLIENTERFLRAAEKAGKHIDFIRYKKHGHNVQGRERVKLFEEVTEYFREKL